ncbi:MAG: HAMP domain-containing histidine kinase [Firmicutes bacterium]|nr:HAMP domain-containing histidine kinase [Bacillota bacterium]
MQPTIDEQPNTPGLPVAPPEKKEAVDKTLKELEAEKKAAEETKKNRGIRKFFRGLGHAVATPFRPIQKIFAKLRLPLTAKMLLNFSVIFTLVLVGYTVFMVVSVSTYIEPEDRSYLIATSAIIVSLAIIIFTALTGVISSLVLDPIRRIGDGIEKITAEDLSKRLEPVDTQDELMKLTGLINGMLENIEATFTRQENFIADASHELKTPISVISGYANMLKRWGAKDEQILDEAIEAIARESENMQRLMDQLLILARVGELSMNVTRFDADEALREIADGYKLVHKTHRICYKGDEGVILETDKSLLIELVRILTDNAVKYTPENGEITMECRLKGDALKISIEDTGMGISPEDLPHIYDRFFRCDKARGREKGGTGLGLTIARSIADTLGGEIDVKSALGKGTKFTFTLY